MSVSSNKLRGDCDRPSPHGWTLDTLEKHLSSLIASNKELFGAELKAVDERAKAALAASEKAIDKSDAATDKRMDAANEIRQAMEDQQKTFADKEQTDFRLKAIETKLAAQTAQNVGIGMSANALQLFVVAVVGVGLLIFSALSYYK